MVVDFSHPLDKDRMAAMDQPNGPEGWQLTQACSVKRQDQFSGGQGRGRKNNQKIAGVRRQQRVPAGDFTAWPSMRANREISSPHPYSTFKY